MEYSNTKKKSTSLLSDQFTFVHWDPNFSQHTLFRHTLSSSDAEVTTRCPQREGPELRAHAQGRSNFGESQERLEEIF